MHRATPVPTTISQALLDELLAPQAESRIVSVVASDWFEGADKHRQAKARLVEFEPVFHAAVAQATQLLGEPEQDETVDGFEIEKWFPEALKARVWLKNAKVLCLSVVQYDADAPVGVILRTIKATEIKDLADW